MLKKQLAEARAAEKLDLKTRINSLEKRRNYLNSKKKRKGKESKELKKIIKSLKRLKKDQ